MKRIVLCILPIFALLTSCDVKNIQCPACNGSIAIKFQWNPEPLAPVEGMEVNFFAADKSSFFWQFQLPGQDGGKIEIAQGNYDILALNNDTHRVLFRNMDSFANSQAFSATTTINGIEPSLPLIEQTELLYTATAQAAINECGVKYLEAVADSCKTCPYGLIRMNPRRITPIYYIRIFDIVNLSSAKKIAITIDGLAESILLASGTPNGNTISMPASIIAAKEDVIEAKQVNFGTLAQNNLLNLYITLADGKILKFSYDISSQIANSPSPLDVYIEIKGPSLPENDKIDSQNGPFDVNVGNWSLVIIEPDQIK